MDRGTDRDVAQWQVVTWLDVSALPCLDLTALPKALGRNDVALLAVGKVQ